MTSPDRVPRQQMGTPVRVGTAGWSIPRAVSDRFPGEGSHLERYARVFRCAEINSTFYRSSRSATYARWARSTPEDFRFSVKMPKAITHESGLTASREQVAAFFAEMEAGLGEKLGPVLVQLPPKRTFEAGLVRAFLERVRELRPEGGIVLEPRHPDWFGAEVEALLGELRIGRVAADPAPVPAAAVPGGWPGLVYHRLHGSPRVYYSSYAEASLDELGARLQAEAYAAEVWCVFDNTASGAAAADALRLLERL